MEPRSPELLGTQVLSQLMLGLYEPHTRLPDSDGTERL